MTKKNESVAKEVVIPVQVGNNVSVIVSGGKMIIEVDLTKNFGASKSGKTIQIASSLGNQKFQQNGNKEGMNFDVVLGLNCYRYPTN